MPVLYKIDDNDSDKVLKDKLRKILDNLSQQIASSDGSVQSVQSIISNITSNNGGSVGLVNHAFTHESGGQDEIKLDNLGVPDDNTDLDASTSRHGLLKKLDNNASNFLNGQGSWAAPASGWDGDIADINLDGGTDIGAALADEDLILVDDGATGTNRKCAMSRLKTYLIAAGLVCSIVILDWDYTRPYNLLLEPSQPFTEIAWS